MVSKQSIIGKISTVLNFLFSFTWLLQLKCLQLMDGSPINRKASTADYMIRQVTEHALCTVCRPVPAQTNSSLQKELKVVLSNTYNVPFGNIKLLMRAWRFLASHRSNAKIFYYQAIKDVQIGIIFFNQHIFCLKITHAFLIHPFLYYEWARTRKNLFKVQHSE